MHACSFVQMHAHTHTAYPSSYFPFTLQNNKLPISGIIQAEAE